MARRVVFHDQLKDSVDIVSEDVVKKRRDAERSIEHGICLEVYPELGAMKINHAISGNHILTYNTESGIKVGDMVSILKTNNIPIATRPISFGFTPENALLIDLEPTKKNKPIRTLEKSDIPWGENEAESIAMQQTSLKAENGEKSFLVGLNGVKIGNYLLTMFASARSKISLSKDNIFMLSSNIRLISKAGISMYRYKDKKSYILNTVYRHIEGEMIGVIHKMEGDIVLAMEAAGLENVQVPGMKKSISSYISVHIILDEDIKKYKTVTNKTKHLFKDRKLTTVGNSSTGRNIHTSLFDELSINSELRDYTCGICEIEGKKLPITYMKCISIDGRVFEFSASTYEKVTQDVSSIVMGKTSTINLEDCIHKSQGSVINQQFPVSENSSSMTEYFGTSTRIQNGDEVNINKRRIDSLCISTSRIYEVDTKSGIETMERVVSPNIVNNFSVRRDAYTEDNDLKKKCELSINIKGTHSDSLRLSPYGDGLIFASSKKEKSSIFRIGTKELTISTSGPASISSNIMVFENKTTIFNGKGFFNGGMQASKEFSIRADRISIFAENSISMQSKYLNIEAIKRMGISYRDSMSISSTFSPIVDKKPTQSTSAHFGSNSISISAENVAISGISNVSYTSANNLFLGGEKTSISGLDTE